MDGSFPNHPGRGFEGGGNRPGGGFRGNEMNAKTRICRRWEQGDCRFGANCNFAHGEAELRALPSRGGGGGGRGRFGDDRGGYGGGRFGGGGPGGYGGGGFSEAPGGWGGPPGGGYGGPGGYGGAQGTGYGGPGGYGDGAAPMGGGGRGGMGVVDPQWASQGYPVEGPNGWIQYKTQDTLEPYYHNARTGETVWEPPPGWNI